MQTEATIRVHKSTLNDIRQIALNERRRLFEVIEDLLATEGLDGLYRKAVESLVVERDAIRDRGPIARDNGPIQGDSKEQTETVRVKAITARQIEVISCAYRQPASDMVSWLLAGPIADRLGSGKKRKGVKK